MKHNRRCRKLIAILLCICLMAPMISGCGEKKEEETQQTSSGTLQPPLLGHQGVGAIVTRVEAIPLQGLQRLGEGRHPLALDPGGARLSGRIEVAQHLRGIG